MKPSKHNQGDRCLLKSEQTKSRPAFTEYKVKSARWSWAPKKALGLYLSSVWNDTTGFHPFECPCWSFFRNGIKLTNFSIKEGWPRVVTSTSYCPNWYLEWCSKNYSRDHYYGIFVVWRGERRPLRCKRGEECPPRPAPPPALAIHLMCTLRASNVLNTYLWTHGGSVYGSLLIIPLQVYIFKSKLTPVI